MILDYIKGFLTLFLLIKILLYFVPKNVFEKYITFFAGVILVIGLLYPMFRFLSEEGSVLDNLQYEEWEKRLLEVTFEAKELEEKGAIMMEKVYQETVEEQTENTIMIETIKIGGETQIGGGVE